MGRFEENAADLIHDYTANTANLPATEWVDLYDEEIIDELTKRGGTGAMCAASYKKHFPNAAGDHLHFPDR